ncbi:unnamed protein product, partial [marine sediment metagenome]
KPLDIFDYIVVANQSTCKRYENFYKKEKN